jgi:hypothetical protein
MALSFFRCQLNERERAVADRLPPGHNHGDPWREERYG